MSKVASKIRKKAARRAERKLPTSTPEEEGINVLETDSAEGGETVEVPATADTGSDPESESAELGSIDNGVESPE